MPNEGQILMSVDRLMLDAKKAILEEQHRRLQILREEGRWEDPTATTTGHVKLCG